MEWWEKWKTERAERRAYRECMYGFEYALSVLRYETDPELHRQLEGQCAGGSDPFCLGMRIALYGYPAAERIGLDG